MVERQWSPSCVYGESRRLYVCPHEVDIGECRADNRRRTGHLDREYSDARWSASSDPIPGILPRCRGSAGERAWVHWRDDRRHGVTVTSTSILSICLKAVSVHPINYQAVGFQADLDDDNCVNLSRGHGAGLQREFLEAEQELTFENCPPFFSS
jgi:hypothetical protein